jgi:AcrR family transcriptional regulator
MRRDAAANRERVLAAAEEVFADHGLAASVEEVARAAGVGMGTLYRRFPTKDDLVGELVRTVLNRFADLAEAALPAADGDGLESFLRSACALFGEHRGCLPRLWSGADERATIERARGSIASLLEAAQRHGKVRAEVTASDVTVALWALRGIVETTGGAEPAVCERHLEVLLAGLRPAPRPLAIAPTDQRRLDELQAAGRRL